MPEVTIDINAKDNSRLAIGSCIDGFKKLGSEVASVASGASGALAGIAHSFGPIVAGIGVVVAAVGSLKVAFDQTRDCVSIFREFDDVMVSVAKTTGMTADEMEVLREGILEIANTAPMSAEAIGEIAVKAGQLGIEGAENIAKFTETVMQLSVACDMSAEKAAEAFGKLASIFELTTEDVYGLGSSINEMANTTAASADQIIDAMVRASSSFALLDDEPEKLAAIAATLVSVSESGERAGTRLRGVFERLASDSDKLAERLGMVGEQFRQAIEEDAVGALMMLLEYYASIENETERMAQIQEDWGRTAGTAISQLVEHYDKLQGRIQICGEEMETGRSLMEEYATVVASFGAQLDILGGQFENIKMQIGEALAQPLSEVVSIIMDELVPAFQSFADLISSIDFSPIVTGIQEIISVISHLLGAVSECEDAAQIIVNIIGYIIEAFATLLKVIATVAEAFLTVADAASTFYKSLRGGEGVIASLAASGGRLKEGLSGIKDLWIDVGESVDDVNNKMSDAVNNLDGIGSKADEAKEPIHGLTESLNNIPEKKDIEIEVKPIDESNISDLQTKLSEITGREVNIECVVTNEERIKELADYVEGLTGKSIGLTVEMTDEEKLEAIRQHLEEVTGQDWIINVEVDTIGAGDLNNVENMISSLMGRKIEIGVEFTEEEKLEIINQRIEEMTGKPIELSVEMTGAEKLRALEEHLESITGKEIVINPHVDMEELYEYNDFLRGIEDKVVNVAANVVGEENAEKLKNVLDGIVDKKVEARMEVLGIEQVDDIDNKLADLRTFGDIPIQLQVEGKEEIEDLDRDLTDAQIRAEEGVEVEIPPMEVPQPEPVEIKTEVDTVTCRDICPESCKVKVETEVEEIEGMRTGGLVRKEGIYYLHKGERVVPNGIRSFQHGGYVPRNTLAYLHRGEYVIPKRANRSMNVNFSPVIEKDVDVDRVIDALMRRLEMVVV